MKSVLSAPLRIASVPFKAAWTAFLKSQSDVEQDYKMLLFGDYKGRSVRLRPVMDPDRKGWVKTWINDPDECRKVDEEIARGNASPPQTGRQDAPAKTADTLSSFNPATASGL